MKTLSKQEYLALSEGAQVLEVDHCGEKVLKLTDGSILKLFRRKRLISSAAFYPYARRFANNARRLTALGIPAPSIIAEIVVPEMARDMVHYHPLAGQTLRELARGDLGAERKGFLKDALTGFIIDLHNHGIYFRSLHLGNVVVTPDDRLGLIDFADLRIYPWSLGKYLRARNMQRMRNIADEAEWLDLDAIVSGHPPSNGVSG